MTYAICAVFALYIIASLATIGRIIREHEAQVNRLTDRIQHPEIRQIEPVARVEHDPPADAAELAQVGQEVPEFVQVGQNSNGGN